MPEQKEILSFNKFKEREYDKLAKLLRENLDIKEIYRIFKMDISISTFSTF